MEYLENINEKLCDIDETDITYYDLFDYPEFFYGNLNFAFDDVSFSKFPDYIMENVKDFDEYLYKIFERLNDSTCGCRIKFKTKSRKIILKVELENKYIPYNIEPENSRGFDVYYSYNGSYLPLSSFAPENDENIFAECISNEDNSDICIFLPNYDCVKRIYVGVESDSILLPSPYLDKNKKAILFYGNEITQGILASKCGCSYPNIVSKTLDQDIINLSCDKATGTFIDVAEYLGHINCQSIVLDCSTFLQGTDDFEKVFENFYNAIRQYHARTKIIMLTSPNYYNDENYDKIDECITKTFEKAIKKNENTFIINQKTIIEDELKANSSNEYDKIMKKIAQSICNCHRKY